MFDILVALEVSQLPIGWLNSHALTNISLQSWTLDTSHLPMGLLNARAPPNMDFMFVTLETSHALMSPLNAKFLWNILPMLVTLDVSHLLTSIRLPVMCSKSSYMFVTWETSQYGGLVHPAYPHLGLDASKGSLAQFGSLEHAAALFSRPAAFSAFIAAFRPPDASLLAGNGAASAAVANALSRRNAAFNFIRMGRCPPRGRGASDGTRRELPPEPRAIGAGGGDIGRPSVRARRTAVGGAGKWRGAVVGFESSL